MLLSFQPLEDVASVNQFRRVDAWRLNQTTSPFSLYFQLVDASKNDSSQYRWPGFRYVPAPGAFLQVNLRHINNANNIVRVATQPFPFQDPSIWAVQLLPTDVCACIGTPDIMLSLTENSSAGLSPLTYPATGGIALAAVGNTVTITLTGGATFATLPAAGTTLVIGTDSDLFIPQTQGIGGLPPNGGNQANSGFYQVTGTSTSTQITATKISDLFYAGLHMPQSVGVGTPIPITNVFDVRTGPTVTTLTGFIQGALRVQTMAQYAVPYQSPYSDIVNDNQTGWLGGPNGQGGWQGGGNWSGG
jgi:hypothetical protein